MSDQRPYGLSITSEAEDDLSRLDRKTAQRIIRRTRWLAHNAAAIDHYVLGGSLRGLFRLRVGDYRVIYDLDHEARMITIVQIGHRRDVYDD